MTLSLAGGLGIYNLNATPTQGQQTKSGQTETTIFVILHITFITTVQGIKVTERIITVYHVRYDLFGQN